MAGALSGVFWRMLFGMIFFVPFFGATMGAAMGAVSGAFGEYGIDHDLISPVREQVTEGTSALFLLTGNVTLDKVEGELKGQIGMLIKSNAWHVQYATADQSMNMPILFALQFVHPLLWFR